MSEISAAAPHTWTTCPGCGWLLYHKRLVRNLYVCPECDHHLRMSARSRIDLLADPGSFEEVVFPSRQPDPLAFVDVRDYQTRLTDAARRSCESEAVVVGRARLGGRDVELVVMEFDFLAGSMGREVGHRVSQAAEIALHERIPLVMVCTSGGARMQEGVFSLLQMARTANAFARLREESILSVCVLTDPTYGGVSASFANLGAIVIAERGAHVGFAGPRVVAETIRAELPEGFQTAEFLLAHGLIDRVENRADVQPLLVKLLDLHAGPHAARGLRLVEPAREAAPERVAADAPALTTQDSWQIVQTARDVRRPTTADYVSWICDDFVELHGDRAFADDPAIIGGIARLGGHPVVVIGHQKGHDVNELVARNFGMPHPEGYRKVVRLLEHAQAYGLSVVTLVDTPGAYPGPGAEERGQSAAIADAIATSARLRVPVVSVITGEGGSGGALALCTSDRLLVLENAFLSVISPEGCAAILWRSATYAPQAARALQLGAAHLLRSGVATRLVSEPAGGAQAAPLAAADLLKEALVAELDLLADCPAGRLLEQREERFARLGNDEPAPAHLPVDAAGLQPTNHFSLR